MTHKYGKVVNNFGIKMYSMENEIVYLYGFSDKILCVNGKNFEIKERQFNFSNKIITSICLYKTFLFIGDSDGNLIQVILEQNRLYKNWGKIMSSQISQISTDKKNLFSTDIEGNFYIHNISRQILLRKY